MFVFFHDYLVFYVTLCQIPREKLGSFWASEAEISDHRGGYGGSAEPDPKNNFSTHAPLPKKFFWLYQFLFMGIDGGGPELIFRIA